MMTGLAALLALAAAALEPVVKSGPEGVLLQEGSQRHLAYHVQEKGPALRLEIEGAGALTLRVRSDSERQWTLRARVDGVQRPVPVQQRTTGRSAEVELSLGAGPHVIELQPARGEAWIVPGRFLPVLLGLPGAAPPLPASSPPAATLPRFAALETAPVPASAPASRSPLAQGVPLPAAPPRGVRSGAPSAARDWHLEPVVGFGFTQDFSLGGGTPPGGSATPQFIFGGLLSWAVRPDTVLSAGLRDHLYSRQYLTLSSAPQGPARVDTHEQKVDADLLVAHELLHHFTGDGRAPMDDRLQLDVRGGPAARFFVNQEVPSTLSGFEAGGEVRFSFSPQLALMARAASLYNLNLLGSAAGPATLYGNPRSATILGAGLSLARAGIARLSFGYDGEFIAMARGYRQFQALTFNLDLGL